MVQPNNLTLYYEEGVSAMEGDDFFQYLGMPVFFFIADYLHRVRQTRAFHSAFLFGLLLFD
jgi:hypothetical protein